MKEHCDLDRLLNNEEIHRLRELLRQQGIQLPEKNLVARIQKQGDREKCPFRFSIGQGADFCIDECHVKKVLDPEDQPNA